MRETFLQIMPLATAHPVSFDQARSIVVFYGLLVLAGLLVNLLILSRMSRHARAWDWKVRRLEQRPWKWLDLAHILLLIVGIHGVLLIVSYVLGLMGWADVMRERGILFVGHSVAMHWAPLVFLVILIRLRGVSWRAAFEAYDAGGLKRLVQGIAGYMAVIPAIFFYMLLYQAWLSYTGHEPTPQDVVRLFMDMEPGVFRVYMVLLAVLLAPIVEEVVFRGVALPVFARFWGPAPAIILVSAAFALLHGHLPSMVPLFIFGIGLSLAYIHTESIAVPVIMHILFNGVTLGIMMYLGYV